MVVLGAVELSIYPLLNSLAMQFINAGVDVNYSLSRGLGSMAFAVACVILGRLSAAVGVERVLVVNIACLAALILVTLSFPVAPVECGEKAVEEQPHSVLYILKQNPAFTLMLVAVFLAMSAHMSIENFMINVVEERGGNETHLGIALFVMGASELPAAIIFPKLWRKLGSWGMMVLAVVFMMMRFIAMLIPVLEVTMYMQVLQMLGFGLFLPTSLYFVNENVPAADRVRGQAVMMMASTGLGGVVGNLVSGFVIDLGGVGALLVFCVGVCVAGTLVALGAFRLAKRKGQLEACR